MMDCRFAQQPIVICITRYGGNSRKDPWKFSEDGFKQEQSFNHGQPHMHANARMAVLKEACLKFCSGSSCGESRWLNN